MNYTVLVPARTGSWTVYETREGVSTRRETFPSEPEARAYAVAQNLPNIRTLFECVVCGQKQFDHFMVHSRLWRRAGLGRGSVHFKCFETLIGRPLAQADFTNVPMNEPIKFGYQMGLRDAQHPHFTGHGHCRACGHRWVAVVDARADLDFLECPSCRDMAGELHPTPAGEVLPLPTLDAPEGRG